MKASLSNSLALSVKPTASALCLAVFLAACGGGGGGEPPADSSVPAPAPAPGAPPAPAPGAPAPAPAPGAPAPAPGAPAPGPAPAPSPAPAPTPSAAWQPAQLLENSNDFNVASTNRFANVPILTAVAPNGDAMAMWEQSDGLPNGTTLEIYSRRYTAATSTWEAAVVVPGLTTTSRGLVEGRLFIDTNGTATWINPRLETRRNTVTGGWTAPFSPAVAINFNNGLSSAVMDASGNIGVLISSRPEGFGNGAVFNTVLPPGSTNWSAYSRVQLATSTKEGKDARVAISNSGDTTSIATAVWKEQNPGDNNYSMKASRTTPGSGWGTPVDLEGLFTNVDVEKPAVAMDLAGNAIAMWCQGGKLYYNLYLMSNSSWQGAVEADTCSGPIQLAMNPSGKAVATWSNGGVAILRSMQYSIATGWTAPVTVDDYNVFSELRIDDSGQAVITYEHTVSGTGRFDVATRRLNFGGAWGDRVLLDTGLGDVNSPQFAMNPAGKGIVIWTQSDVENSDARNSLWSAILK